MNNGTLLHRIIKPRWWVQDGVVSSQAFRPEPRDEDQMSVYDGDQITVRDSYNHYASDPSKTPPIGVLSITVEECSDQELPVQPDPNTFPEHVLVDFRAHGTNATRKKSGLLRDAALRRGWQFIP